MTRTKRTSLLLAWALAAVTLLAGPPSAAAEPAEPAAPTAALQEVTDFGPNPTNLRMHLYVPDSVAADPAILVGLHWCTGTGPDFFNGTQYAALADQYGFVVVYPSASNAERCWDVHSEEALTHDGGSDPQGIVSMVEYVERTYGGDPDRVFATGHSSGGMMTNVLLGSYPDVFRAGSASAGVPFGCFAGESSWNAECATGNIIRTPQEWGDLVRAAYPGYEGPRPPMQLWHGTEDDGLYFQNFEEEIKQWTDVHGVSQTPTTTEPDTPRDNWTRTRYGSGQVEAIRAEGEPHNLPILAEEVVHFLGLDRT
ncbi:PHB depolymerase family esterase [Streptomyces sp. B6B3]|uniref:extracellular catalytic domain type 1 short-chain-length polyhydroxyalkanoate depolymerase n=1 Tax=Streptomyces sp. B6B3 TaxID=3153570 RepID=UPI00325E16EE